MQITFESRDADGAQIRELALERVRFTLRRLAACVPYATVRFSDINGPRGGVDKRCLMEFKTDKGASVVIASLASDWRTALERALRRATRAITRSRQRVQKPTRGRSAKWALDS